jgi:RNA methyltransferase, TrmH family
MLSQAKIRSIQRLERKKYRYQNGTFLVEGIKGIRDGIAAGLKLLDLFIVDSTKSTFDLKEAVEISEQQMKQISQLTTPSDALAVFEMPELAHWESSGWILALDKIQDPGNLGTILRTADWFGWKQVWCSKGTVDVYHPKVVQATMGSYARMHCHTLDLENEIRNDSRPAFAADLSGISLATFDPPQSGILVIGNEGNGLSQEVSEVVNEKIHIASAPSSNVESLNAAVSTAIIVHTISNRLWSRN